MTRFVLLILLHFRRVRRFKPCFPLSYFVVSVLGVNNCAVKWRNIAHPARLLKLARVAYIPAIVTLAYSFGCDFFLLCDWVIGIAPVRFFVVVKVARVCAVRLTG